MHALIRSLLTCSVYLLEIFGKVAWCGFMYLELWARTIPACREVGPMVCQIRYAVPVEGITPGCHLSA